jgi:hypothetical protein
MQESFFQQKALQLSYAQWNRAVFSAKSTARNIRTMQQSSFFRKKHCNNCTYNATELFFFCKKQCNKRTYKCTMQEFFFCKKHCKKRTYNATEQFSPQNNTATNVLTMQQSFFSAKSTARNVLTLQKKISAKICAANVCTMQQSCLFPQKAVQLITSFMYLANFGKKAAVNFISA